jgi:inorganic pyrophosphatase
MTGSLEISAGDNPPDEINVIVEIPSGSSVKYEVDKATGAVFVDRFLSTATHYPFNYGFIPKTREEDGDPLDVLVLTQLSVFPNTVIRSRPVGLLLTEDENGQDAKVIAAPAKAIDPYYQEIEDLDQIPEFLRNQIEHFFKHYKELEPTKFVKVVRWESRDAARKRIREALKLFQTFPKTRRLGSRR